MTDQPPTVPEKEVAFAEGHRAGWLAGYEAGKGAGYSDARVRSRLALEATFQHLELPHNQRAEFLRANEHMVGKTD